MSIANDQGVIIVLHANEYPKSERSVCDHLFMLLVFMGEKSDKVCRHGREDPHWRKQNLRTVINKIYRKYEMDGGCCQGILHSINSRGQPGVTQPYLANYNISY